MDNAGIAIEGRNVSSLNNVGFMQSDFRLQFSPANANLGGGYLNSIDIVAHEYTHGVSKFEIGGGTVGATFAATGEPGALDESFSDILGTMAAWYTKSNFSTGFSFSYVHGSDVMNGWQDNFTCGSVTYTPAMRINISNPNSSGHADTYLGQNYIPAACNHPSAQRANAGVMDFWFYLLAEGGSGTNDNSNSYCVNAIGKDKAMQITYYNLCNYMGTNSNFAAARTGSIQAAINLGYTQDEIAQVTQAWYAVGVGPAYAGPFNVTGTITNTQSFAYNSAIQVQNYTNQASSANVTIKSNTQIAFLPNVSVQNGSILNAFIGPTCGGNGAMERPVDDPNKGSAKITTTKGLAYDLNAEANANAAPQGNDKKVKDAAAAARNSMTIMPNPSNGSFVLMLNRDAGLPASIVITDVMGKVVKETGTPATYDLNFDLGNAAKGIYLIKVNYKGETVMRRMVKNQ
jgi:hypothetical protein